LNFSFLISANSLILLIALIVSLSIAALVVFTQRYHGHLTMDSTLGVQKFHVHPTPRVGGLGIYIGLLVAWLFVKEEALGQILKTIVLAGIPAFVFGILEDLTKRVGVIPRLLATMASGLTACLMTGLSLNRLDIPMLDDAFKLLPVALLFTSFAIGGVANAINIIDGFHGLASGAAIIILLALSAIAFAVGDVPLVLAALLVAAVVAGFWFLNYPWGKIFLGDGGAYFTGFAMAWLAVLLLVRNPQISPWVCLLVFAYPVIEVLYSVVRRYLQNQSPGAPDSMHLHSLVKTQIIRKKLPNWRANLQNAAVSPCIWGFVAIPAGVGVLFYNASPMVLGLVIAVLVAMYHLVYTQLVRSKRKSSSAPDSVAHV
jgi:UDP-N-acetylmuramyl pentapeptide phosphotransferase/UDP-N-acetylglucosamine-1-phosphate transferase